MNYGVGCRSGSDPALLRLWRSSDWISSLGTFTCCGCGPRGKKKRTTAKTSMKLHKIQFCEINFQRGKISVYEFFEGVIISFVKASLMKTLEFCNKMSFQIRNSWFKLASSSH